MRIHKKLMIIMMTSLLILSIMSIFGVQIFQVGAQGSASLTGNISDSGVDTDGDGDFNYLKVGVEVNVTESGDYHVGVHNLRGTGEWQYIYVEDTETEHLDVGVHVIYVSLYGPTIYESGIDAVSICDISLNRIIDDDHYDLDMLYDIPLSREYNYTEFDSPFTDAEVTFIVDPDGRVVIAGALTYTDIPTQYTGPVTQGVMAISKSDDLTSVSTNCTFTIPPEVLSEIPFDSIDFTLSSTGSEDVFDTEMDCSVVLSEDIASQFPFNITDFTATGQYDGNLLTGTITLHMLPGFALGDLDIDFEGNRTDLSLSGNITVFYGTYYDFVLDEAFLDGLIQNINSTKGRGPESLYNMTEGMLECTTLDITKTPFNTIAPGATIDFNATIHGDFVQALAYVMVTSYGYYPPEMFELAYSELNATYSSVESASFELTYAYEQKKTYMRINLVSDSGKFIEEMISSLPETIPPEIAQLIESLLETRYCSMKSYECTLSYGEGEADLKESYIIEGDPNAEINFLKSTLLTSIANITQQPLPWELSFLNETEIDVSNCMLSFNLDETSYSGYLGGFAVFPPLNNETATSFQLTSFFNLAADVTFPEENQRLKVTVAGGCNATHTVTLSRPETVPEPTHACDNRIMVWDNQTLIDLKDLIFNIQPETGTTVCDVTNPDLICAENPFVVNATETPAATLLSITELSKPVTIIVKNVTTPPEDVKPPTGTFKVLGNYVEIVASETDITVNATIRIYYTSEQLEAAGLDENTLKIHYWDATLDKWVAIESHVNKAEHYVWAVIDHFSIWTIIGQPPSPFWTQLWFWAVMGIVIVAVIAVAVYAVKRRKPPTSTLPESIEKI